MALRIETKIEGNNVPVLVVTERSVGEKEVRTYAYVEDMSEPVDFEIDYTHKKGKRRHRDFCKTLDPQGREYIYDLELNKGKGGYRPCTSLWELATDANLFKKLIFEKNLWLRLLQND